MDAGSGEHGIILAFLAALGKWSVGKWSRVSALARSALAAHASPGPRGDAPARVGVRDLVEVDLGECATVNAWVNGERLTLLLQLDGLIPRSPDRRPRSRAGRVSGDFRSV